MKKFKEIVIALFIIIAAFVFVGMISEAIHGKEIDSHWIEEYQWFSSVKNGEGS